MKSKKNIIIISIFLSSVLLFTGCMSKIREKVGTKIGEKVIEKVTDNKVSIDKKDGLSIDIEGGSMKTGDNLEWPKKSMGNLPEPKAKIFSITELNEEDSTSVVLAYDNDNGGSDYLEKIKDLGYEETMLNKYGESVMFSGVKDDGTSVAIIYQTDDVTGSIIFIRNSEEATRYFEEEKVEEEVADEPLEIDMSESMDWPKISMNDIPEIKAQISSVSLNNEYTYIGFKNIREEDIVSYIEDVKSLGYTINTNEAKMKDFITYSASNEKNQSFSITWSSNEGSISYKN